MSPFLKTRNCQLRGVPFQYIMYLILMRMITLSGQMNGATLCKMPTSLGLAVKNPFFYRKVKSGILKHGVRLCFIIKFEDSQGMKIK